MFDHGTIVMVPFPYTDQTATKMRPALVLSGKTRNQALGDLVVCGITSNLSNSPSSVLIEEGDMATGTLVKPSRVKVDKLLTIHSSLVRKAVGRLKPQVMRFVWKELHSLFPSS